MACLIDRGIDPAEEESESASPSSASVLARSRRSPRISLARSYRLNVAAPNSSVISATNSFPAGEAGPLATSRRADV